MGNETADKCAKSAAELPSRCLYAFTSLAYIKRQTQQKGPRERQYGAGGLKPVCRLILGFFKAKCTVVGVAYSLRA